MCLVLGTFPETLAGNHHLSLLVFKTPPSYNREVLYVIVLSLVGSIVAGKNKQVKVCLQISIYWGAGGGEASPANVSASLTSFPEKELKAISNTDLIGRY